MLLCKNKDCIRPLSSAISRRDGYCSLACAVKTMNKEVSIPSNIILGEE